MILSVSKNMSCHNHLQLQYAILFSEKEYHSPFSFVSKTRQISLPFRITSFTRDLLRSSCSAIDRNFFGGFGDGQLISKQHVVEIRGSKTSRNRSTSGSSGIGT